jgi:hypothetical protein
MEAHSLRRKHLLVARFLKQNELSVTLRHKPSISIPKKLAHRVNYVKIIWRTPFTFTLLHLQRELNTIPYCPNRAVLTPSHCYTFNQTISSRIADFFKINENVDSGIFRNFSPELYSLLTPSHCTIRNVYRFCSLWTKAINLEPSTIGFVHSGQTR